MKDARSTIVGYAAALAVLGAGLSAGCSGLAMPALPAMPWQKVPLDASAGFYESGAIVYRLDAGQLAQPLDVARVDGQKVSYEQFASSPLADQSIGTLSITYPHPGGRAGCAQARFALDSAPTMPSATSALNPFAKKSPGAQTMASKATPQGEIHEVWVLDIPSTESDQYFKLLAAQSFYNTERPEAKGARLTVTVNGSRATKNWDQLAELNALIQRVRRQGQLVAYSRPAALAGVAESPITSVRAYHDLLAQTGTADAAATAQVAANPFSMQPAVNVGAVASGPVAAVQR